MKPRGKRRRPFVGPRGDEPHSVPYPITEEQREHVKKGLRVLRERAETWREVSNLVDYPVLYLSTFMDEKAPIALRGQRHFAAKVAEVLGVELDDLLAGKVEP